MHIQDLMPSQVIKLREDVTLNSIMTVDYSNRFGIDENEVYDFFDEYLYFLQHFDERIDISDIIEKYDNKLNLLDFWKDYCFTLKHM